VKHRPVLSDWVDQKVRRFQIRHGAGCRCSRICSPSSVMTSCRSAPVSAAPTNGHCRMRSAGALAQGETAAESGCASASACAGHARYRASEISPTCSTSPEIAERVLSTSSTPRPTWDFASETRSLISLARRQNAARARGLRWQQRQSRGRHHRRARPRCRH
jgi:hypothetical protein